MVCVSACLPSVNLVRMLLLLSCSWVDLAGTVVKTRRTLKTSKHGSAWSMATRSCAIPKRWLPSSYSIVKTPEFEILILWDENGQHLIRGWISNLVPYKIRNTKWEELDYFLVDNSMHREMSVKNGKRVHSFSINRRIHLHSRHHFDTLVKCVLIHFSTPESS